MLDAIPIPEVVDHEHAMSKQEVEWICQEYVDERELPCTLILIDDRVCYAYMNADGSSQPVQCFKKEGE